jgi:GDP-4-dehydro-6-deoxy-D-mannose reductase
VPDLLVTGARGFVGKHVMQRAGGAAVAFEGDLRDRDHVESELARLGPRFVIHLASGLRAAGGALANIGDEVAMAANLLAGLQGSGAVLLVPGSAAQYGMGAPGLIAESAPTVPVSAYGAANCVLEQISLQPAMRGDVRVIWARAFNHVGPGQGPDAPVPAWADAISSGRVKTGRLDVVRDFLDVRDVADAYLALVRSGAEGVVNVCSGAPVRLSEVVVLLIEAAGADAVVEEDPALVRRVDPPSIVGDPSLLHSLVAWRPSISLDQSLRVVVAERAEAVA